MGTLFIVATPIGNLKDISLRALETLKEVDLIVCEDTRHTRKLLSHFDIHKPLERFDAHAKESKIKKLIQMLQDNKNIALVTDAGTPAISDPGSVLVQKATEQGIRIIPIPGPSAVTTALSISGFPSDRFTFLGFIPHKKGRTKFIKNITETKHTVVFFESPHRIKKLLDELKSNLQKQSACNYLMV